MEQRTNFRLAIYLFLQKQNKVLLTLRKNTGFMDGFFSTISGHIEPKENMLEALNREAKEEANIKLSQKDTALFHIMSRKSNFPYYDFFYKTSIWQGKPIINESNLCSEMSWFNLDNLPENTVPYIKFALQSINKDKLTYSSVDW